MRSPPQRIVVKETTYWQSRGSPAVSVSTNFVRYVNSDETPYTRPRVKVGESWRRLETGWLKKVSMVIVENPVEVRQTIPSPEEVKAARSKVVEIGMDSGDGPPSLTQHLPVGETVRILPPYGDPDRLMIRCMSGETFVNLTAIPGDE